MTGGFETASERWRWYKKSLDSQQKNLHNYMKWLYYRDPEDPHDDLGPNFKYQNMPDPPKEWQQEQMQRLKVANTPGPPPEWVNCGCKDCKYYQEMLDKNIYQKLLDMGKPQAAEYHRQLILEMPPHSNKPLKELQESFLVAPERVPRDDVSPEAGRKSPPKKVGGDVIPFPDRTQNVDKQLQIEFYNRCAQLEKALMDLYNDPKYESMPDEMLPQLHDKARDLVWNGGINFTQ